MANIRHGRVQANGIEFTFIEAGDGPLVLLLHGFPDDAWTWAHQLEALAAAGYRTVAPYMRGYAPTEIPADGRYDPATLAADVVGLVGALGDGPAYVVGNDWGGIATSAALALHPEAVRRAVLINVGHPATFMSTVLHPKQVHHIFHFWFFQTGDLAAGAVRANDLAFVDYLWDYWSTDGHDDARHIDRVKRETLSCAGVVEAALAYYRALLDLPTSDPATAERMQSATTVPTLTIFGDQDPPRELSYGEHVHYATEYRLEIVEGAGHFVHRERADAVNRLILDWFAHADQREPVAEAQTRA